jgi:hypothetical protein
MGYRNEIPVLMANSILYPDLHPSTARIRAIVTTRWGKSGYRPIVIPKVESYYVDTALDNDADTWTFDLGDPFGEITEVLARDSEVRVQLFGVGREGTSFLTTGIADEISYGDDGILTFTGRDYSSLATDSTVPPGQFRHQRAGQIVKNQAREIGFSQMNLDNGQQVKKLLTTDGSESYWEFWYRLYRREQKWLWCEPNGILSAGRLNYESEPSYFFGVPHDRDSDYLKRIYIPVEGAEFRKSTQQRVYEVYVYGHKGDNGFLSIARDPTMRQWLKKPRRVMLDTESHTLKGAQKTGWEEIFEGKVGSREMTLTIPDPGFPIRQNRVAHVHIPEIKVDAEWFVVGVRIQGGANGFVQEVRLREKQYAISRRVPQDPKIKGTSTPGSATQSGGSFGTAISALGDMPEAWGSYFVKAANAWHGPWDYNLFLATLIGIADQETGGSFMNERQNGGPGGDHIEWYPWEGGAQTVGGEPRTGRVVDGNGRTRAEWEEIFANELGSYGISFEAGVGPMQLTDRGLKNQADDRLKLGNRNQFSGGRWSAEHNIWVGAKYLRDCLQGTVKDSGRDIDMWMGVMAYNRGVAGALSYFAANGTPSAYAISVKNKVYNDPGYVGGVKNARDTALEASKIDPGDVISPSLGKTNDPASIENLTWIQKSNSSVDLAHVDWRLLNSLNSLGARLGRIITITSGFRSYKEQKALWDRYRLSGFNNAYIAANPDKAPSNHQLGKACDCTVGGVAMANAVPAWQLAVFGLHCPVSGDPVHTTLQGVSG